jgi:hypothetical protein
MKERKSSQPFTGITLQAERRSHPRFALQVQLELHEEGSDVPIRLTTTDLSRGGCYVQTNMPLAVGIRVYLRLWLGHTALRIKGRIVTSHPQFGNGIMFIEYEGDGQKVLADYLDAVCFD